MSSSDFWAAERQILPILAAERTYDYTQTPANFYATPPELRLTTNCKDFGHEALRHLRGIALPPEAQLFEAHLSPDTPQPLFSRVRPNAELRVGDWIMLGRPAEADPRSFVPEYGAGGQVLNWSAFDINHAAVYMGTLRGEPMVGHATPEANGAEITELNGVMRDWRTSVIHEVLRAMPSPAELAA